VFVLIDGDVLPTRSRDIGLGGMLLERPAHVIEARERQVDIRLPGLCGVAGHLVSIARETLSVRFCGDRQEPDAAAAVARLIHLLDHRNTAELTDAHALADRIEAALEQAVADGAISPQALIAGQLTPRPGSDPPQYAHPARAVFEGAVRPVLDAWLAARPAALHAAAIDQRGYVAAVTAPYRQPQRPGEPVLNHNLSQEGTLRVDPWSLGGAKLATTPLVQTRSRDVAPQHGSTLRATTVPLRVSGRRWGAVEVAFRAEDDALLRRAAESAAPSPA
jgi:hypothetical protein